MHRESLHDEGNRKISRGRVSAFQICRQLPGDCLLLVIDDELLASAQYVEADNPVHIFPKFGVLPELRDHHPQRAIPQRANLQPWDYRPIHRDFAIKVRGFPGTPRQLEPVRHFAINKGIAGPGVHDEFQTLQVPNLSVHDDQKTRNELERYSCLSWRLAWVLGIHGESRNESENQKNPDSKKHRLTHDIGLDRGSGEAEIRSSALVPQFTKRLLSALTSSTWNSLKIQRLGGRAPTIYCFFSHAESAERNSSVFFVRAVSRSLACSAASFQFALSTASVSPGNSR